MKWLVLLVVAAVVAGLVYQECEDQARRAEAAKRARAVDRAKKLAVAHRFMPQRRREIIASDCRQIASSPSSFRACVEDAEIGWVERMSVEAEAANYLEREKRLREAAGLKP